MAQTLNHDVAGLARRINRFIDELQKAANAKKCWKQLNKVSFVN